MNNNPKVSIVVPIYNNEKYLKQCVESILAQTLKEIEIILVDDGSTDNSPAICDEYARKDERIKVIHQKNGGLGVAYNSGTRIAKGTYIGYVESDDWIDPLMYEKLYEKAEQYKVDVVKAVYTEVRENGSRKVMNKFAQCKLIHQKVENAQLIPELIQGHLSHWSALYKSKFLKENKISYPTTPGASIQDVGFFSQVFVRLRSIYIMPQSYYFYRCDNPNNSSSQGFKTAKNSLLAQKWLRQWLVDNKISIPYREHFAAVALRKGLYNINKRCRFFSKIRLSRKEARLFREYLPEIKFKFFTQNEKDCFIKIAKHPILFGLKSMFYEHSSTATRNTKKLFGIKIKEVQNRPDEKRKTILGVTYYRELKKKEKIKYYFCGIRYKSKVIKEKIRQDALMLNMAATANAIAATHSQTFPKYKNSLREQEVMIVASGPTVLHAPILKDIKHLAVNRAITLDKYHFDYHFVIDNRAFGGITDKIISYDCKKFFGRYAHPRFERLTIPDWIAEAANAERFFSEVPYTMHAHHDIEFFSLADYGTIVHMALHFLLYTHPKRIYLVGCDTDTSGYYDKSLPTSPLKADQLKNGYMKLRDLRDRFYPDVEIVSINPVGLRGMFNDVYTPSYLQAHPELRIPKRQVLDRE